MNENDLEKLRFPNGKFTEPSIYDESVLKSWINDIDELPSLVREECRNITEEMLDENYRPGGWNFRQVIHHLADSHMNGYIRFKLALTEEVPVIKPYNEDLWAHLHDSLNAPPEISLLFLEVLHKKWILLLRKMTEDDFDRKYFHPESRKEFALKTALGLYSWHGKHHLGHIKIVKRKFAGAETK